MNLPPSIPEVADVELLRGSEAPADAIPDLVVEVPHGASSRASYEALRASDFHAPHIPTEYGGAGADALATAIVIEEVARACASSVM